MEDKVTTFKNLIVWQKSMDLAENIYKLTEHFPKAELYGLTSQMRRCAVSIPSNIAEGRRRGTKADYRRFLFMAFGSGGELETQILLTKRLNSCSQEEYLEIDRLLDEIMRMLNRMLQSLI